MAELLIEIGLEEVPARMLAGAERELGARVLAMLGRERLLATADGAEASAPAAVTYSTPRRLAVRVPGVAAQQPESQELLTGPAWSVAFKDGVATPAGLAFAKKAGVAVEEVRQTTTPKGAYASATRVQPGREAAAVLTEMLPKEIAALGWPKPMYWRAGKPERFVRPVKWLLVLLGEAVVPVEFAGVATGGVSYGHRVLHGAAPVPVSKPGEYAGALRAASVLADVAERRERIRKALDRVTRTVAGARWREDESLVETVTHLTEWPSVVLGSFDPGYLRLPEEVLVTVMRDHQKYFALESAEGRLLPHFLAVLNTETNAAGEAVIRHGNERVLRARFNDAQFFWDFDAKTPMEARTALLEKVTFQKDLGSYAAKTERTLGIAVALARLVSERNAAVDGEALEQAVRLAKVDLTTELVKEFTELQGIVGGLYLRAQRAGAEAGAGAGAVADASADASAERAAKAIYWQYLPASISDPVPPTAEGQLLGLADRMGTIADLFALGLVPSGSKDPYALRRAANAVIKILAVGKLPLSLVEVISTAVLREDAAAAAEVRAFLEERLSFYLREVERLPTDAVLAVVAAGVDRVPDAESRARALADVRGSEDLAAIAAAWKRTKNILRQASEKQVVRADAVHSALLHEPAERGLWEAVGALVPVVERHRMEQQYRAAIEAVATLRPQVDRFFDETMVLVEDAAVRANRLALLQTVLDELGRIADFSELTPGSEDAQR